MAMLAYDGPARLSPCGESGLKSAVRAGALGGLLSLPMRGEWIEISDGSAYAVAERSGLSPCGESGLKFRFPWAGPVRPRVSPHAGRVD